MLMAGKIVMTAAVVGVVDQPQLAVVADVHDRASYLERPVVPNRAADGVRRVPDQRLVRGDDAQLLRSFSMFSSWCSL